VQSGAPLRSCHFGMTIMAEHLARTPLPFECTCEPCGTADTVSSDLTQMEGPVWTLLRATVHPSTLTPHPWSDALPSAWQLWASGGSNSAPYNLFQHGQRMMSCSAAVHREASLSPLVMKLKLWECPLLLLLPLPLPPPPRLPPFLPLPFLLLLFHLEGGSL
jgi:hypothetical protein